MKKIIIVESPGKVQSIQKYVGDKFIVYASNGQIVDLAKGGRFGIGVNPLKNFKPFYCLDPNKVHFLDKIISDVDNIDEIIIATDPDTEGHGIAWHIAQNLKHLQKRIVRAEFHEITQEGIQVGLSNLSEMDENKFKAQETRRILDRIVGFMVSPFLINSYGSVLSAGRVQSVATKMVIEREREINKFEPQEYWNIGINLIKDNQKVFAKYQGKIKTKEAAEKIKLDLEFPSVNESIFQAISVSRKSKKEQPNPPLTTARMQQLMASKFNIDGERTMQAAQSLYELGFVTYIRTDSVRISNNALENVRSWLVQNNFEIPNKPNLFENKDSAQNAHECIRPTNLTKLPEHINLADDVNILYKLIWIYFVSSQMCPAIYDTLNIKIIHSQSKHQFKVSGKTLIYPGYLSLLEEKNKSENPFPNIIEHDFLKLENDNAILLEQKFTQPPPRYNYASLLKELESKGIGRPSTYIDIISKITNRNYVEKQGNTYFGTKLGDEITSILSKYFDFMKYEYTAELEKEMDAIALGKSKSVDILSKFYLNFKEKLKEAHLNVGGKICAKCSAPMYVKRGKKDTKFLGCSLYPFCDFTENVELQNCA